MQFVSSRFRTYCVLFWITGSSLEIEQLVVKLIWIIQSGDLSILTQGPEVYGQYMFTSEGYISLSERMPLLSDAGDLS